MKELLLQLAGYHLWANEVVLQLITQLPEDKEKERLHGMTFWPRTGNCFPILNTTLVLDLAIDLVLFWTALSIQGLKVCPILLICSWYS